jgi:hypothetical protein
VLSDGLSSVSGGETARYSVAVLQTGSGAGAEYGDGSYDTASIVKVDILATLLLQAQDGKRELTTQESAQAKVMIENSDNTAATALWESIGRAEGLHAANKRIGLTDTEGGSGLLWGLTQTTAADQLRLLRAVFGTEGYSALSEVSRAYIQGLMGRVSEAQTWGVPSAAASADYEVKNGWLKRTTTQLWDINSIGRVKSGGHTYLVAVLSKGNTTQADGMSLVEEGRAGSGHSLRQGRGSRGASEVLRPRRDRDRVGARVHCRSGGRFWDSHTPFPRRAAVPNRHLCADRRRRA